MSKCFSFLFCSLALLFINAQSSTVNCEKILASGDCSSALQINPVGKLFFPCSPKGFGQQLEMTNKPVNSIYFFKEEHNTIWLKFTTVKDGLLTFKLTPIDSTYDYDFILYKNNGADFCKQVKNEKYLPIRSNISRNDQSLNSVTGLSLTYLDEFISSGPNEIFSKAIAVKEREEFYLLIDNVYGGDKGFYLEFKSRLTQTIKGRTFDDETNTPIEVSLEVEDISNGEIVAQTKSDSITGEFYIDFNVEDVNKEYRLITKRQDYFFTETPIDKIASRVSLTNSIDVHIQKLKKDANVKLHNLNFYGDSDEYLPTALPTLKRLLVIMQNNPSLCIQIEGHTNGCSSGIDFSQVLSENRALAIANYLIHNNISRDRLISKGFNCSKMLYPNMRSPWEQKMNRRVEILVTDF